MEFDVVFSMKWMQKLLPTEYDHKTTQATHAAAAWQAYHSQRPGSHGTASDSRHSSRDLQKWLQHDKVDLTDDEWMAVEQAAEPLVAAYSMRQAKLQAAVRSRMPGLLLSACTDTFALLHHRPSNA